MKAAQMGPSMRTRIDWRGDCGQQLVEFALASTIFFTTIFGVLGFGLAVWHNMVADLAQEGARWAAVRGATSKLPDAPATDVSVSARPETCTRHDHGSQRKTTWPDVGSPANAAGKKFKLL